MRRFVFLFLIGAALAWPVGQGGSVLAEQPQSVATAFAAELPRTLATDEMTDESLARLEAVAHELASSSLIARR